MESSITITNNATGRILEGGAFIAILDTCSRPTHSCIHTNSLDHLQQIFLSPSSPAQLYQSVLPDVITAVKSVMAYDPKADLYLTGHSLG